MKTVARDLRKDADPDPWLKAAPAFRDPAAAGLEIVDQFAETSGSSSRFSLVEIPSKADDASGDQFALVWMTPHKDRWTSLAGPRL